MTWRRSSRASKSATKEGDERNLFHKKEKEPKRKKGEA